MINDRRLVDKNP